MADYSIQILIFFFIGFLCGSIPCGYLISRLKGIDITKHGSKNIGFTNVYRNLGPKYAIPVFLLDMLKGFLPTFFTKSLGNIAIFAGVGAILGHIFTPWLYFRGGKGVATTIGVILALIPKALLIGILIYSLVLILFRYVSLASIIFSISLPILVGSFNPQNKLLLILSIGIGILIIVRHAQNIVRLVNRTEPKFDFTKIFRKNT
ncbi:MAG: glycerol-3-phosphate 1-O-acyltransferase PlsY [candidate division WOR-3 bacterium]|nr:glycerol-3-phosphate 1-O-acyltransferase PlsY [candidate division WOR-3 bacterium]MCX7757356.1 glycerol-3-phosphate 1-O-acyltransferase PlsY [candidate division WOR-3 bacterium]MDW7987482.1 glycerol-3-phosphate 1-O-acyltransferase PlsY [candidate division WOR-3 bacterium]